MSAAKLVIPDKDEFKIFLELLTDNKVTIKVVDKEDSKKLQNLVLQNQSYMYIATTPNEWIFKIYKCNLSSSVTRRNELYNLVFEITDIMGHPIYREYLL